MVPDIAKTGHSFKGAMAYYLHDKGAATSERVAWTETRNLATDDPRAAMRIMVATATSSDELKAAAGIKTTGRKSKAHVYAYSLAWHPDEAGKLDKAEMLRAVDGSLKALGADHLQSVIVCHQDQKHPHVHVIVNRVDPATGKMLSTSNDRLKLSDWANAYERERGQILTPKREEKRQLREQFAEKSTRQEYAQEQRAKAEARSKADRSQAAMLKEFQEAQKADHKKQWADLSEKNKAARSAIYDDYKARIGEAITRHKAECKPIWAQHFRDARAATKQFDAAERTIAGKIVNAAHAAVFQKATGQLGQRGLLSATFGNVLSSDARATAFQTAQDMHRMALASHLKGILDDEIATLKKERSKALAQQREAFNEARAGLIEKQDGERAKIREAWRQIYADRGKDSGTRSRTHRERIERKGQWQAERRQTKEHRAEQSEKPRYRRDISMTAEQTRKGIERKEALRPQTPTDTPAQEKPAMRGSFDKARSIGQKPAAPAPTKAAFISRPAPAPSPAGEAPRPAQKRAERVPVKPEPKPITPRAVPAKDWKAASRHTTNAPAAKKDWSQATKETKREIKPLPPRSRDKDRDR